MIWTMSLELWRVQPTVCRISLLMFGYSPILRSHAWLLVTLLACLISGGSHETQFRPMRQKRVSAGNFRAINVFIDKSTHCSKKQTNKNKKTPTKTLIIFISGLLPVWKIAKYGWEIWVCCSQLDTMKRRTGELQRHVSRILILSSHWNNLEPLPNFL